MTIIEKRRWELRGSNNAENDMPHLGVGRQLLYSTITYGPMVVMMMRNVKHLH